MTTLFSLIRSLIYLVSFKLSFPKDFNNESLIMEDGRIFKIFRHMSLKTKNQDQTGSIFIVRFKFNKFSHKKNIKLSRIPILMIAGFPGFRDKIWMIDWENGYWQGLYQWDSVESIEKYKKSFVLGIMNKRSDQESLSYEIIENQDLEDYLKKVRIK